MTAPGVPVLEIEDLSVVAGGRRLLASSSFTLTEGERVLLVGPSGAGKSLFVDLLLGFAGPGTPGLDVSGALRLDGDDLLPRGPGARDHRIGALFQAHAPGLFDDLTIRENLRFGSSDPAACRSVEERLGLEAVERRVVRCSGGERVRVALARTLLRGAGVLVYDEPTSGLDAGAAPRVVSAIRESHARLTLVVTHDYEAFADFADRILFLDPATRRIVSLDIGPDTFARLRDALRAAAPPPPSVPPAKESWGTRTGRALGDLTERVGDGFLDVVATLAAPLAWFRAAHPLDGPRVRRALARHLAPGVGAFVAASAVLVALTATYFLFEHLPQRAFAEPLFLDDLLAGLGLVLTRVAVPLVVSVLLAAKLGASTAAHLGHMSLSRQVDALHLLRVPIRRHLLLPAAAGQLAAAWVHTALALALAFLTALLVFLWDHPGWSALYFQASWFRQLGTVDLLWVAAKVGASALAVAAVAFRAGTGRKEGPGDVVRAVHGTLLWGLLAVLALHAVFAFLEFG